MNANTKLPEFDVLVALYKKDPVAYEAYRKEILDSEVASAPPELQEILKNTICRIEIARKKAKSPLEAAIVACRMMLELTNQLRLEIEGLRCLASNIEAVLVIDKARRFGTRTPRSKWC